MNLKIMTAVGVILLPFLSGFAHDADTLQPGPEGKDAYVDQDSPTDNFGDDVELWTGIWAGKAMVSYLEFDLSRFAGRVLDSCFLDLWCHDTRKTAGVSDTAFVWRVSEAWQENTVTWATQPGSSASKISAFLHGNQNDWWTWNVRDLVQDWLDGFFPNRGFACAFMRGGLDSYAAFHSSDGPYGPWHPRLRLYFTQQSITITSPNGGEYWLVGSMHRIYWTSVGGIQKVKIIYTPNWSANQWFTIADNYANTGSIDWTIPDTPGNEALVQIDDATQPYGAFDVSNAFFTIAPVAVEEGADKIKNQLSLTVRQSPSVTPVIQYSVPERSRPSLRIYSPAGRTVRDLSAVLAAGRGSVVWDGADDSGVPLPQGIYFCLLGTADGRRSVRVALVRGGGR